MSEHDEMKRRHHNPDQIVRKLRVADRMCGEGMALVEVINHLEDTEQGAVLDDDILATAILDRLMHDGRVWSSTGPATRSIAGWTSSPAQTRHQE